MKIFEYIIFNIVESLLRFFPVPSKTGLVKIGNPAEDSPVFLTCNYHLTVQRVKWALKGKDAYLLVANSRGINVWCAASGGHFTNHDVISVLKTSGIEDKVSHRKVILPQLAAAGIEARVVHKKSGWRIIWGPVNIKDIQKFLGNRLNKSPEMREVQFPLLKRIEMAAAWAFPMSIGFSLITLFFWQNTAISVFFLVWVLSLLIFACFPLYSPLLKPGKRENAPKLLVFKRFMLIILLFTAVLTALIMFCILTGNSSLEFIIFWGIASSVMVFVLSIDLAGSTPLLKSGLLEEKSLSVVIDTEKCKGSAFCIDVCPRNCFAVDKSGRTVSIYRAGRCVGCGACIIQCPFDAIYFESAEGDKIDPATLREFKLNILGKRSIKVNNR